MVSMNNTDACSRALDGYVKGYEGMKKAVSDGRAPSTEERKAAVAGAKEAIVECYIKKPNDSNGMIRDDSLIFLQKERIKDFYKGNGGESVDCTISENINFPDCEATRSILIDLNSKKSPLR